MNVLLVLLAGGSPTDTSASSVFEILDGVSLAFLLVVGLVLIGLGSMFGKSHEDR